MKAVRKILTLALFMVFASIPLGIAPAFAEGDVVINDENFPDELFKSYVTREFDTNHDGTLSQSELDAVTIIDYREKGSRSFKGVEHFTNLQKLYCDRNKLTELDLSQNLALETLWCYMNELTALDISQNTALTDLMCGYNQITALDISQNTALTELDCSNNNLSELNVSQNQALQAIDCAHNQLTELDLSQNPALQVIDCGQNRLTELDLSQNPALQAIDCAQNQLAAIDLSQNPALLGIDCFENKLTELDVSQNLSLQKINCAKNQLKLLDLSQHSALRSLSFYENQLTSLDITNTAITDDENFNSYGQAYDISVDRNSLTFDLSSLPGDFDVAKTSNWRGGSVSGTTLTIEDEDIIFVDYTYKAKEGKTFDVSLEITYTDTPIATTATISFDAGGGSGTMADETVNKGSLYTLPECTFTAPANKKFKGWAVGGEGKAPGESITISDNTTVKAMWGSLEGGEAISEYKPNAKDTGEKAVKKIEARLKIGSNLLVQEINGAKKDIKMDIVPYIKDGRTMLPIRFIAEALGLEVEWLDDTRTVTLKGEDYSAEIPVDTNMIRVGGKAIKIDVKPEIKDGRTMLPLRHVAEALGFDVEWLEETETVIISKA